MADAEVKEEPKVKEEDAGKEESREESTDNVEAQTKPEEPTVVKTDGTEISVVIDPKGTKEITIKVEEGQVLSWNFTLEGSRMALGMDIGFGVKKRLRSEVDGKEIITDWELPWNGYGKLGGSMSSFFASNRDIVRYAAGIRISLLIAICDCSMLS